MASPGASRRSQYEGEGARRYEEVRAREAKWQREQEVVGGFLEQVANETSLVLDVPVGTGRFLPDYLSRGCRVVGLDLSADMLAEASKKVVARPDVELRVGDITAMDLADRSVDVSVCVRYMNLVDLQEAERALSELARVTRRHVIVGIRIHGRRGAAWRIAWRVASRVKGRLRGTGSRVTVHPEEDVMDAMRRVGLHVTERRAIAKAVRGSSHYFMYLLRVDARPNAT